MSEWIIGFLVGLAPLVVGLVTMLTLRWRERRAIRLLVRRVQSQLLTEVLPKDEALPEDESETDRMERERRDSIAKVVQRVGEMPWDPKIPAEAHPANVVFLGGPRDGEASTVRDHPGALQDGRDFRDEYAGYLCAGVRYHRDDHSLCGALYVFPKSDAELIEWQDKA